MQQPASYGFDATSLKSFPDAFLPVGILEVENLLRPTDKLRIGQDRSGHYFVTDDSGFNRQVRDEVEGNFFLYAQQRGQTELRLPKEMFKVFSAVAGYEKYCRELHQKPVRDLEARSRNRTLAEQKGKPVAGLEPAAGKMAHVRFFHRKTRAAKTGASSSAAMANAVSEKSLPMFDRKKGRFFGWFCRKTGVSGELFYTLFCVFPVFRDFWRRKPLFMSN